jgi:adenylosuccinate lyase
MKADLEAHWEVAAEGAQTILRTEGVENPYELLKQLTRGKALTEAGYREWVDALQVDDVVKDKLRGLSPLSYIGLAQEMAEKALREAQTKQE